MGREKEHSMYFYSKKPALWVTSEINLVSNEFFGHQSTKAFCLLPIQFKAIKSFKETSTGNNS